MDSVAIIVAVYNTMLPSGEIKLLGKDKVKGEVSL